MGGDRFGSWLRQLRTERDLTQEGLAQVVGCASQTVRSFEVGRRRPSREMAARMADVLDLSPAEREHFLRLARAPLNAPKADLKAATPQPPRTTTQLLPPALPTPTDDLIGRHYDQERLRQLLIDEQQRLVTLLGTGGIGKTRLAIQAATNLTGHFADGAIFVPLASVNDLAGVVTAIATAVGCPTTSTLDTAALVAFLRPRAMLLVLDNLEHLLASPQGDALAGLILAILDGASQVRLLVTSRERLRLRAEWLVEIGGLGLPHDDQPQSIARSDAVLLFVERARRVANDFVLGPDNQANVAAICRRLDGLPLALELAAAQTSFLPPVELLARLDQALPLLEGGARDLPARQRTMRGTIDWSYQLLHADDRRIFDRLGVFAGGFGLAAAEAVCGADGISPAQVLGTLRRLVDQSLVVRDDAAGEGMRSRLLEPVRQFALEQLERSGGARAVRQRHAVFFGALATQAYAGMRGNKQVEWMARLNHEYPNLRAAMLWLMDQGEWAAATQLHHGILLFQWLRGHLAEGRSWMERVLEHTTDAPPNVRAHILLLAGRVAYGQSDYDAAAALNAESLALYRTLDNPVLLSQAVASAGLIAAERGQIERAVGLLEEGVERYIEVGDTWGAALLLIYWAAIPMRQGDYVTAARLTERALPLARANGDSTGVYTAFYNLATVAQGRGDGDEAMRLFRRALELSVEVGDESNIVYCVRAIAGIAAMQGDVEQGARLWGAGEALLEVREAAGYAYSRDIARYEQALADARAQLSADEWQALWAEGRKLSMSQAVALALGTHGSTVAQPNVGAYVAEERTA